MSSAENDTRAGKFVWISDRAAETIDACAVALRQMGYSNGAAVLHDILDARDAAPADPAEAIEAALFKFAHGRMSESVHNVLAALGAPKATP